MPLPTRLSNSPSVLRHYSATQRGQSRQSAEAHRLDGARRDDDHRALLLDRLVKHVHGPEMQADRVVLVLFARLNESRGDLGLSGAEDDAGLALALGLSLAAHGVLESLRQFYVADLH